MRRLAMVIWRVQLMAVALISVQLIAAQAQGAPLLIPIDTATANVPNNLNTPSVLISDAMGDYNYSPPSPSGGGGGTSWHTNSAGSTPVRLVFDFEAASRVDAFVLWDYYGHTPRPWLLELFPEANAGGAALLSYPFSTGSAGYDPRRWDFDVADTTGVLSARLTTQGNAIYEGVGLSEVAFVGAVIPEPATLLIWSVLGALGAVVHWRRKK